MFASEEMGRDNNRDEEPTQTDEIRTREMWMSRRTCEKEIANRRRIEGVARTELNGRNDEGMRKKGVDVCKSMDSIAES